MPVHQIKFLMLEVCHPSFRKDLCRRWIPIHGNHTAWWRSWETNSFVSSPDALNNVWWKQLLELLWVSLAFHCVIWQEQWRLCVVRNPSIGFSITFSHLANFHFYLKLWNFHFLDQSFGSLSWVMLGSIDWVRLYPESFYQTFTGPVWLVLIKWSIKLGSWISAPQDAKMMGSLIVVMLARNLIFLRPNSLFVNSRLHGECVCEQLSIYCPHSLGSPQRSWDALQHPA